MQQAAKSHIHAMYVCLLYGKFTSQFFPGVDNIYGLADGDAGFSMSVFIKMYARRLGVILLPGLSDTYY